MGAFSIWHVILVLLVVLVVFGAGKLPNVMGDMAKGVRAFKRGLNDDDAKDGAAQPPVVPQQVQAPQYQTQPPQPYPAQPGANQPGMSTASGAPAPGNQTVGHS